MLNSSDLSSVVYQRTAETMILSVPVLLWFNLSVAVHWPLYVALTGSWAMPDWIIWLHYAVWPFFLTRWSFGRDEFLRHMRRALNNARWL